MSKQAKQNARLLVDRLTRRFWSKPKKGFKEQLDRELTAHKELRGENVPFVPSAALRELCYSDE